ncbi:MAG: hypothetical protein HC904_16535 [Blastochloris sp.]|nr:hypothetical protein [Blastochloris sp.]
MKPTARHLSAIILCLCWYGQSTATELLRDPEAFYLEDAPGLELPQLKVKQTTPLFASRSLNGHIGNLITGQTVLLLAWNPKAFLVSDATASQQGWVAASDLEEMDAKTLDHFRAVIAEETRFAQAIKKNEVISGMTFDHVLKSLGEPSQRSFREDENGRYDVWSFIIYRTEYEDYTYRDPYSGRLMTSTRRIQVPTGETKVEFKSGRVVAVQQSVTDEKARHKWDGTATR